MTELDYGECHAGHPSYLTPSLPLQGSRSAFGHLDRDDVWFRHPKPVSKNVLCSTVMPPPASLTRSSAICAREHAFSSVTSGSRIATTRIGQFVRQIESGDRGTIPALWPTHADVFCCRYIWGLIWLVVVELSERWSLARICQLPARYGKSLPLLLLSEYCCPGQLGDRHRERHNNHELCLCFLLPAVGHFGTFLVNQTFVYTHKGLGYTSLCYCH